MKTTNLEEMRIAMETYYEEVCALHGGQGGGESAADLGGHPTKPGDPAFTFCLSLNVNPSNSGLLLPPGQESGI